MLNFAVIPVWVAYDSSQHSFCAQIQAKEADIHALSELTRALSDVVCTNRLFVLDVLTFSY